MTSLKISYATWHVFEVVNTSSEVTDCKMDLFDNVLLLILSQIEVFTYFRFVETVAKILI